MEACVLNQAFIVSGRSEDVVADGTAGSDLLMGDSAADDESVAEEQQGGWFEDAKYFPQECEAFGNMAQNIVGEGRVECGIGKGQCLRDVAVLEGNSVCEMAIARERVGVANACFIDIHAYDAA